MCLRVHFLNNVLEIHAFRLFPQAGLEYVDRQQAVSPTHDGLQYGKGLYAAPEGCAGRNECEDDGVQVAWYEDGEDWNNACWCIR